MMHARLVLITTVLVSATAWGAPEDANSKPAVKPGLPPTVAVLDYQVNMPGNKEIGSQMAVILTVRLSVEDTIRLVERAKLGKIIAEQKLKLTGIVSQDQSAKVGKLLGAKLMVMGKGFMMDKKLMIVTKVVGVETGQVKGTIRTVAVDKPLSDAILLLSEDIATLIVKNAKTLLPEGTKLVDPVAEINKALGKAKRPTVAVIIPEEHKAHQPAPQPWDPAAETEVKRILLACGCTVVDTGKNALADWARGMLRGKNPAWPAKLAKADFVVVGEAFSEFAARTDDLVTCAARAEVNLIDRKTGKILVAGRDTQRAVDLAENVAGKTALQKAGHVLGLEVAKALAKTVPPAPAKRPADKPDPAAGKGKAAK